MTESLAAPDLPEPPSNEYIRASIQRVNSLLSAVRPLKLSTPRVARPLNRRPSMLEDHASRNTSGAVAWAPLRQRRLPEEGLLHRCRRRYRAPRRC